MLEAGDAGARFPLELEGEGCVHSGAAVGWFGAENEGDGRVGWIGKDPEENGLAAA